MFLIKTGQIDPWSGNQGGEPGNEIQWLEDFVHGYTYAAKRRDRHGWREVEQTQDAVVEMRERGDVRGTIPIRGFQFISHFSTGR